MNIDRKKWRTVFGCLAADKTEDTNGQYTYISNEPRELPLIPDFPQDYDWKSHNEKTLCVSPLVTIRSLKDGSSYSYESRISYITNLHKKEPDCYFLTPVDMNVYTIKEGDSLQKIAMAYYGNRNDWIYILNRNKAHIKNADAIYPGTLIVIPNADAVR